MVMYEMMCGHLPFRHENDAILFEYILKAEVQFPAYLSPKSMDLLYRLLRKVSACQRISVNVYVFVPMIILIFVDVRNPNCVWEDLPVMLWRLWSTSSLARLTGRYAMFCLFSKRRMCCRLTVASPPRICLIARFLFHTNQLCFPRPMSRTLTKNSRGFVVGKPVCSHCLQILTRFVLLSYRRHQD